MKYECREFKIQVLRECGESPLLDTPDKVAEFFNQEIKQSVRYCEDKENFVVIFLDTRRRAIGFEIVTQGIVDSVMVHAREIFKPAIAWNAHAIICLHNHPSGDPTPSEADVRVNRDLIRAGQLLRIELLDSIVMGEKTEARSRDYASLRELGYFYS